MTGFFNLNLFLRSLFFWLFVWIKKVTSPASKGINISKTGTIISQPAIRGDLMSINLISSYLTHYLRIKN